VQSISHDAFAPPLRSRQPGDEEKASAVVANVKATIERYKDYRKGVADGYAIANPKLKQPQYHCVNLANTHEADLLFDASSPLPCSTVGLRCWNTNWTA
jgi:hypothetical protein